jgi:hypothetical protein
MEGLARPNLFASGQGQISPLGFASFCGPRQLGKASDPRLMVPRHDPILFDLASHPTLMGSNCGYTQGFWVPHFRGAQSSWTWCCSQTHLNLDKFIILINIKNIIICIIINTANIKNIIICIINFIVFIIINIFNIIIKKF